MIFLFYVAGLENQPPSTIGIISSVTSCGGGSGVGVNGVNGDGVKMAPVTPQAELNALVNSAKAVVFTAREASASGGGGCGGGGGGATEEVVRLLAERKVEAKLVELKGEKEEDKKLSESLRELTGQEKLPSVFVNGMHVGESSEAEGSRATQFLVQVQE